MGHEPDFYSCERRKRANNLRLSFLIGVMVTSPLWFIGLSAGLHWATH